MSVAGEAVIRTLEKSPTSAILAFGTDSDVINFMKYPATAIACDCGSNENGTHPRYNGTFTRVLGPLCPRGARHHASQMRCAR
jgi:hypothetical protein